MLKSERKYDTFFLHDITHLLYNVVYDGFKNTLFPFFDKLYFGLDPDDATMCKQLVGL